MTRGLLIHNPCNLRLGKPPFLNEIIPSSDSEFRQFKTPEDGIRAATKTLLTYYRKYKLKTIHDIISRWAPPKENNTNAYIKSVSEQLLKSPFEELDLDDKDTMTSLIEAITRQEQGCCPYSLAQVDTGVSAAYV